MARILVLNSGSSSVKFAVVNAQDGVFLASGLIENIGDQSQQNTDSPVAGSRLKVKSESGTIDQMVRAHNHQEALLAVVEVLRNKGLLQKGIDAVGHRVVHGGEAFSGSVLITPQVLQAIEACSNLAPLHNPANLKGIEVATQVFPNIPQVAVFDTAFHQTIPPYAYLYALPKSLYTQNGIRRYGFHGTSHRYVSAKAAEMLGIPQYQVNLITAHLGNGCSATAIENGKSVDTTMGLTPMEGIPMGTRSGTIDPGILVYLHDQAGMSMAEINTLLNKKSGLLGLSNLSNDMRTLNEAAAGGHGDAELAINVFCWRLAKEIASLSVALNRIDALVFTGGIGENSPRIREKTLAHLGILGFQIDSVANQSHGQKQNGIITTESSIKAMVVPTNEELLIAMDAAAFVS